MSHHLTGSVERPIVAARNAGIDVLRGIAILLVILLHLRIRIPVRDSFLAQHIPGWLLTAVTDRGHEAVYVFFVISGFLITSHTLMRWGQLHLMDPRAFWARRAARILPCLLVLVGVLSILHLLEVPYYTISRPGQTLSGAIVAALGFHINWYEGQTWYLPANWDVLWSLAIEEVFYLGFPVACLLLRDQRAMMIVLAIAAASLPILKLTTGGSEIWQQKAYLPGMAAIAAGVLAALIASTIQAVSAAHLRVLYGVGLCGLIGVLLLTDQVDALRYALPLFLTLSTMCLLIALGCHARSGSLGHLPRIGWLASMGRLSYEIYLSHMFIVLSATSLARSLNWDPYWGFVWYLPTVVAAWGLGSLVERHLSGPAMRTLLRERKHGLGDPGASSEYLRS